MKHSTNTNDILSTYSFATRLAKTKQQRFLNVNASEPTPVKWDEASTNELIDLMEKEVPVVEIYECFYQKNIPLLAVHDKMKKLRTKHPRLKKMVKQKSIEFFVDTNWNLDDLNLLVSRMASRRSTFEILQEAFPYHSALDLKQKINALMQSRLKELNFKAEKAVWSKKDEQLLRLLKAHNTPIMDMCLLLGRTITSIEHKMTTLEIAHPEYDWSLFEQEGYLKIPIESWPVKSMSGSLTNFYYLVHPKVLSSSEGKNPTALFRSWIQDAEKNLVSSINVWVTNGKQEVTHYFANVDRSNPQKAEISFFSPKERDLMRATMLADGALVRQPQKKESAHYCFEFSLSFSWFLKTPTLPSPMLESRLGYILWFYNQINPIYRTPTSFYLSRDLGVVSNVKHRWKTSIVLENFPDAEVFFNHFYGQGTDQQRDFLRKQNKKVSKHLPSLDVFWRYFSEGDIDFMLSHLYMQKGSASTERSVVTAGLHRTVSLSLFASSREQNELLAFILWKKTGLKCRPVTSTVNGISKTELFLCLSSVPEFFNRVKPHMLPCMEHKVFEPETLTSVATYQDKAFDILLAAWEQQFGSIISLD
uniref:Orf589 n=1 Tax=Schizomeris leibleinii TaxID=104533 RepID=F8SYB9_9CHLO|nr:orf589 [Schizomeris leibleinii]AEH05422.1 orf589 [Schizomeris leibleinii]